MQAEIEYIGYTRFGVLLVWLLKQDFPVETFVHSISHKLLPQMTANFKSTSGRSWRVYIPKLLAMAIQSW